MKRLVLAAAACRLIEQSVSQYEDVRDDKGKSLREPKERRQWDRMADLFVTAAGAYDQEIERLLSEASAWGTAIKTEQAGLIEALLVAWRTDAAPPEAIAQGVEAVQTAYQMRFEAKDRDVTSAITALEDTLGLVPGDVDLEDSQIEFLSKAWENQDLRSNRRMRRVVNQIEDALKHPVELVREGDRYVPVQSR